MPEFRYRARNPKGELVDGTVTANDKAGAISQVERKNLVPIKVQIAEVGGVTVTAAPQKTLENGEASRPGKLMQAFKKVTGQKLSENKEAVGSAADIINVQSLSMSHAQQHLFSEQLAHLLSAGMTLDESLGVLVKRLKHPKLQALSKSLHRSLLDGRSLSQAMRDFPRIFSPLYVNMVSAGEVSGSLSMILRRLTAYLADIRKLKGRVQQALMYPGFLALVGIGLVLVFMNTMVPQLMSFFKDTGASLPAATQFLITTNNMIASYWWAFVVGGVMAFMLFKVFVRSDAGRIAWDRFKWNIPVFSRISRYRFYAQFAQTLGTLTENGVILMRALELLENIAENEYIRQRLIEVRNRVMDGATLSGALTGQGIVPEMFVDMMGVGEQTGKFSDTMAMIADVYERELEKQVQVVSTLIPPMVMVVIAAVIGTVIYGILVAVFNLTSGLGRAR